MSNMSDDDPTEKPMVFGYTARQLARNPLGIIALFIVLIYSIAGLVFGFAGTNLEVAQKWPLIIFLVTFPLVVFSGFIWLVAAHAAKLYAPSDFKLDATFVELNRKISVIEVRQQASEIDPRAGSESAPGVLNDLLNLGQIDSAVSLAKAFLKVKRYDVSLEMFSLIIERLDGRRRSSVIQYRAYSLIGQKKYHEALRDLDALRASDDDELFDFWPQLGVAFCHFKLNHKDKFEAALTRAMARNEAAQYRVRATEIYPELAGKFDVELGSPSLTREAES
jgi:tetratricopeptide (TPR) repeat protein